MGHDTERDQGSERAQDAEAVLVARGPCEQVATRSGVVRADAVWHQACRKGIRGHGRDRAQDPQRKRERVEQQKRRHGRQVDERELGPLDRKLGARRPERGERSPGDEGGEGEEQQQVGAAESHSIGNERYDHDGHQERNRRPPP